VQLDGAKRRLCRLLEIGLACRVIACGGRGHCVFQTALLLDRRSIPPRGVRPSSARTRTSSRSISSANRAHLVRGVRDGTLEQRFRFMGLALIGREDRMRFKESILFRLALLQAISRSMLCRSRSAMAISNRIQCSVEHPCSDLRLGDDSLGVGVAIGAHVGADKRS